MFSPKIGQQEWFDQVFLAMIGRKRRLLVSLQQDDAFPSPGDSSNSAGKLDDRSNV